LDGPVKKEAGRGRLLSSARRKGRSTWLPGSLASDAGLPKSGAIWQNRKIFFQIMEGDSLDRLEAMSTFLTVVEQGSLSAAARRLKTPLTTVSRNVSELESHLRTKLFSRSSRQLVLTDTGASYVAACKRILTDVTEAERTASGDYAIPTQKSVDRFKDQIRALTMRRIPLRLGELIETINPIIRGWGNYYCRPHRQASWR
jgi:molybdenum-dependent DNA-binding transcriptional regulator ModE